MKRNITIAIEEGLAREAKVLAAEKDTSVSQLLAEHLKTILQTERNQHKAKKNFLSLTRKKILLNYGQRDFPRASLHER